jgi:hypothetical protein
MAQQVEIVNPNWSTAETFGLFLGSLLWLGVRVLIVWWAVAAWFPQYGLTYWQLILPVWAFRALIGPPIQPRRKAK